MHRRPLEIRITASDPRVRDWLEAHMPDWQHAPIVGDMLITSARLDLASEITMVPRSDGHEFANSIEAAQVALERLAALPDADVFASAKLLIEIDTNH